MTAIILESERFHVARDEGVAGSARRQVEAIDDRQRDALWVIERELQQDLGTGVKTVDGAALDAEPDAAALASMRADRDAFVEHLMQPLMGQQVSKGALT